MEQHLAAILRGSAAVTALVPATSINFRKHPQGRPWPGLVLSVVNDQPIYQPGGILAYRRALVQCGCWASSYDQALQIIGVMRPLLQEYRDDMFANVEMTERDAGQLGSAESDDPAGRIIDLTIEYYPN